MLVCRADIVDILFRFRWNCLTSHGLLAIPTEKEAGKQVCFVLIWRAAHTGFWMLLHFLNLVPIRNTSTSVHLIIVISLLVYIREIFRSKKTGKRIRPLYTFWGIMPIFAAALISIAFYYIGILPPANSAVLFAWGLLALIICMLMDTVIIFGRMWKENQYTALYR